MEKLTGHLFSLRGSLFLCFGGALILGQLLYIGFSDYLNQKAMALMNPRPTTYFMDHERVIYVYTGEDSWKGQDPDDSMVDIELMERLALIRKYSPVPIFGLSILGASALFYQLKLKKPLRQLNKGMNKIAAQDLDFTLPTQGRDEMGRLCEAFEQMRRELKEAFLALWRSEEQQRMLYRSFSHDLRTPLSILKGNHELIEICAGELEGKPAGEITQAVKACQAAVGRMELYAAELKNLEAVEYMQLKLEETDMVQFAAQLRTQAEGLAQVYRRRIEIENQAQTGNIDAAAVQRVLDNLLDNALRFSKRVVSIQIQQQSGGKIKVTVSDDGGGFSMEALKKGAEPFYSAQKAEGHSGIGLAVAKGITEQCGGSLSLANNMEGGAMVTVTF